MKEFIKKTLISIVVLSASLSISAYDFRVDGICYKIISESDRTIEVTYLYDSSYSNGAYGSGEVDIPSKLIYNGKTYTVVAIGHDAFAGSRNLTSVIIPKSVTEIKYSAFSGCRNLAKVAIPNSVTEFGHSAFSTCTSLHELTIPDKLKSIGDYAFHNCWSISSIFIPSSVEEIGYGAFMDCISLSTISVATSNEYYTSVDGVLFTKDKTCVIQYPVASKTQTYSLPENVSRINGGAFRNSKNLTSIKLPINTSSIGQGAFSYCTNLLTINLPDNVVEIGISAFNDCSNLTECIFPDKITSIADYMFENCFSINRITLPSHLKSIGYASFHNCKVLQKIIFPEQLQIIGNNSFSGCGLISINIPNSVKEIQYNAFGGCPIKEIFCNWTNPIECDGAFWSAMYSDATLYIPVGTMEKYSGVDPWRNFFEIKESELCSVIDIIKDSGDSFNIYNTNGTLVAKDVGIDAISSLPHGIYIAKSEGKTLKIKI